MRRLNWLAKFALLTAIPIVVLGLLLTRTVENHVEQRIYGRAVTSAELLAHKVVAPRLSIDDVARGLSGRRLKSVDAAVRAALAGNEVAHLRIWSTSRRLVYSDSGQGVSALFPASYELRAAFAGRVSTGISGRRDGQTPGSTPKQFFQVYVPLRIGGPDSAPVGAFEVSVHHGALLQAIEEDIRETLKVLLPGLLIVYAAVFFTLVAASRKLRRQAEKNHHQALHDVLTGLPNRSAFREEVQKAINSSRREGLHVAVIILDLDRFKEVNDTLGHHNGDLLLQQITRRFQNAVKEINLGSESERTPKRWRAARPKLGSIETIARLGGDEFAILLPHMKDPVTCSVVAEQILKSLEVPFMLQDLTLSVGASIGVSMFPQHGSNADALIQRADVAMYLAKERHSNYEVYSEESDQYSPSRLVLIGELRRAIEDEDLVLHYQPKVDLRTGQVRGVEALVRWGHPVHGLMAPDKFVPLAEHTGLMRPLVLFVLNSSLRQLHMWHEAGIELSVAVNLSVRNLMDLQLPDDLDRLLRKWNVSPAWLELEITESTIMSDPLRSMGVVSRLSRMGVRLAIDDFGTGYSSLAYLKQLPVDSIKIDKSFVQNMVDDEEDAVIVRSTIDLGHNLGLKVIAEGVETRATWDALFELNCDLAQGYYLSRPVPASELTQWISQSPTVRVRNARPAAVPKPVL